MPQLVLHVILLGLVLTFLIGVMLVVTELRERQEAIAPDVQAKLICAKLQTEALRAKTMDGEVILQLPDTLAQRRYSVLFSNHTAWLVSGNFNSSCGLDVEASGSTNGGTTRLRFIGGKVFVNT
jgi:hypothetical protein